MPLIVFKRSAYRTSKTESYETPALNGFNHTVNLSRVLKDKKWILKSVSVLSRSDRTFTDVTTRMKWFEIRFPQLMPQEETLYARGSEGSTPLPREVLRFYPNKYSMDNEDETQQSTSVGIVSTPNIHLGNHSVEEGYLSMEVFANEVGTNEPIGVTCYEVILEYQ